MYKWAAYVARIRKMGNAYTVLQIHKVENCVGHLVLMIGYGSIKMCLGECV
jgi:hypothetical protein